MDVVKIGVIGGSGLYQIDGFEDPREIVVDTPYGEPSDSFAQGRLAGVSLTFLPRHGRGHVHSPSDINYRANIFGMKKLGVTHLISVSACGSLKEEIEPGHIVMIDQFFDRTKDRRASFFGDGVVAHVAFADPVCPELRGLLLETARSLGVRVHDGGTYVCMEGPQFSTRAESRFYRSIGAQVIGMTNLTEAKLAREAGICYATMALSTDYDCWRTEEADVDIQDILKVMAANVENAKRIIAAAAPDIRPAKSCGCPEALKFAIVTDKSKIPPKRREELALIAGPYLED